jgi:acyl carrier protein
MIGSGARHIVLASRNPSSAAGWAEEMSSKGAFVSLNSVDVTDARSMGKMLASIRSRPSSTVAAWPPIAGVIHLGLLLKDTAFSKMTFEDFQIAANVKTTGSVNLHEHLSKDVLDFFILTSSLSYIAGNPGQANYNCGNAFMAGLAQYRRNTGLPASVVHLGHVRGVGYITRTSHSSDDGSIETYRKRGIYPVSERDLHHIYAEAVLASPADSGRDPEIITGLREITPDILEQAPWAKQPFFAHLITQGANGATAQTKPQLSVREKLSEELSAATAVTTSPEEKKTPVQDIVRDALLHRLGVLLQTDVKHIDEEISLLDMGIDSLVASEIGSWARKELRVQIPHSMIFGGASVTDIVGFVVKHLDKGWVMLKGGEAKENEQGKE